MSDDTSNSNDQVGKQDSDAEKSGLAPWSLMESTTLEGKLGVIICWYFDTNFETKAADRALVTRMLKCARWYLDGHIERLTTHDLLRLQDAVASYPRADLDLDKVDRDLFKRLYKQLIAHDPPTDRPPVGGALAEVPTVTLEKLTEILRGELRRRTASAP